MAADEESVFRIYNSMTRQKEVFEPIVAGKVGMYVCGVTAYALSHIGHARAAVSFDILYRYLQHLGYEVTYVRNFTDIDDKIIKQANELKTDPMTLSRHFCDEYIVDMDDLQCIRPTHQPCVTTHIEQITDMINQIYTNGSAYVNGDVFFDVDTFPKYGQLSGQKLENLRAGNRVESDPRKQNPYDFALWKEAKSNEPSWESPWGLGRPGWHIECSAMSSHYLTHKFDIHGGGIDLIFPHHENEIAQSCAANRESDVRYWMHNGHVTNNNVKMSKSLGNFFTIRQITERYHPLAVRYCLISVHYRTPLNYSIQLLEKASESIFYIYQTLQDCEDALLPFKEEFKDGVEQNAKKVRVNDDGQKCISNLQKEFRIKMSDDLNTSNILTGAFLDALKCINSLLTMLKKKLQKQQKSVCLQSLIELEKEVTKVLNILGMLLSGKYSQVLQQLKEKALKRADLVEEDISRLIEERTLARNNKEFAKSDQIRADLTVKGIALMDVGKETIWMPCEPPAQKELGQEAETLVSNPYETPARKEQGQEVEAQVSNRDDSSN